MAAEQAYQSIYQYQNGFVTSANFPQLPGREIIGVVVKIACLETQNGRFVPCSGIEVAKKQMFLFHSHRDPVLLGASMTER